MSKELKALAEEIESYIMYDENDSRVTRLAHIPCAGAVQRWANTIKCHLDAPGTPAGNVEKLRALLEETLDALLDEPT